MAIGDLYEMTTHVRTAEGEMQFSVGYKMEVGTINATTLIKTALFFAQNRLNSYVAAVSDDIEVDKVTLNNVSTQSEIAGFVNFNNLEGTLVGEAVPNNAAPVLSILTNAPNAKHNGRIFLPGLREQDQQDGIIQAGPLVLVNAFGTALLLDIATVPGETIELTPVVISRVLDGAPRVAPVGFLYVSCAADNVMKQQRRRGGNRFGLST